MISWSKNRLRNLYYTLIPDHVAEGQFILPEKRLRTGGPEFKDDQYFIQSALAEVNRLVNLCQLDEESNLLDIGCGFGRLAIGLKSELPRISYVGVDVNSKAIDWCRKYVAQGLSNFEFIRLDVANLRYNPAGTEISEDFQLPFEDGEFTTANLYSVFSHMLAPDVQTYLRELRRVVQQDGHIFFTAFAEPGVPDVSVNPPDYGDVEWEYDLHCVRFNHDFLMGMIAEADLQLDRFDYGQETNGQSALYVSAKK